MSNTDYYSLLADRSWMYQRKNPNGRGINPLYMKGVATFIQFAYTNSKDVSVDCIRCPCSRCNLVRYENAATVEIHILRHGFLPGYEFWDRHGEVVGSLNYNEVSSSMEQQNPFTDMVMDVAGPSFDWGMEDHHDEEPPNPEAAKFYKLLRNAKQPLYPGCRQSRLEAITKFLAIKSDFGMPEACYDRIMKQVKSLLPQEETLTDNYYQTKKVVKSLGLSYIRLHACENNCILYYREYEKLNQCPTCGTPRYQVKKSRSVKSTKGIPRKELRYFPITPRLQRLFMSVNTAKHMTWYKRNHPKDGEMVHPSDGDSWKHFDKVHPLFAAEPRNVRLGLATDGFDPFSSSSAPYSCWPVFLTPYNLPPWMCMKQPYLYLTLIIPGHPGKNLDVYLRPLIDELNSLWVDGIMTYDASRKQNFTMKAALMWTIGDFPAYSMLSGWSTHGLKSCPHCMGSNKSFMLPNGRKPCYFDCHRRFLPSNHSFRRNRENFTKGKVEKDGPPPLLTGTQLYDIVTELPNLVFGNTVNGQKISGFGKEHNWVKKSIFWELPYWRDHLLRYMMDMMHIEKNNFDNIFNTILDVQGKTKDNAKARLDLRNICKRPELELIHEANGLVRKPKACYTLSKQNRDLFCGWVKELSLPDGYASNISRCVRNDKFIGLKSHDCHVLMERLLPIGLRGMLPNPIWDALTELSNFFKDMCSTVLRYDHLNKLQVCIVENVCKLEKIFPPAFFDSMEHLVIHLPYEAKCGGPVQYRWMYPFERCKHHLKRKVRNKARVEGSIAEAYMIEEISTFCSIYFEPDIETRLNRVSRNDDVRDVTPDGSLSLFKYPGRGFGRRRERWLTDEEHKAAQIYVLLNCDEVIPYIESYDEDIRSQYPQISDSELEKCRERDFSEWFKNHASNPANNVDSNIKKIAAGPSKKVRCYNGYIVNGFRFHTEEYGECKKTMNSGVRIKGSCYDSYERDFYGMLKDILELSYFGNHTVLFKCHWYDYERGLKVHPRHGVIDVKYKSRLSSNEPFVLAHQAHQVYYSSYPAKNKDLSDWWAIMNVKSRGIYDVHECDDDDDEDGVVVVNDLYQEDEMRALESEIVDNTINEPIILRGIGDEIINLSELPSTSTQYNTSIEEDEVENDEENDDEDGIEDEDDDDDDDGNDEDESDDED